MKTVRTTTNIKLLVDAIEPIKERPVSYRFSNGREFKQKERSQAATSLPYGLPFVLGS